MKTLYLLVDYEKLKIKGTETKGFYIKEACPGTSSSFKHFQIAKAARKLKLPSQVCRKYILCQWRSGDKITDNLTVITSIKEQRSFILEQVLLHA